MTHICNISYVHRFPEWVANNKHLLQGKKVRAYILHVFVLRMHIPVYLTLYAIGIPYVI